MAGNIEIKDCHIVELGAGTGFLGLHLLKSIPSIKSYNFTDGHRKCTTVNFRFKEVRFKEVFHFKEDFCCSQRLP